MHIVGISAVPISMSFKSQLRPIKRATAHVAEQLWSLGFGAEGKFAHQRVTRWKSPGGERVLIVAPHPDDEAVGCGGTLLMHVDCADTVCIVIATDGRQSTAVLDPDQMAYRRRCEAMDATRLMQIERLEWIGLAEGAWSVSTLKQHLGALIEAHQPDIIYAPSRIDFHPEHFQVAHSLALALADSGERRLRATRVRIYQIQVPLHPLLINLVADVTGVWPRCEAVLRAYASQTASLPWCRRQRRYSSLRYGTAGYAEVFWELSAQRYVALHRDSPEHWSTAFRGLRNFPLTDPVAYLAGLREQRRIKYQNDAMP